MEGEEHSAKEYDDVSFADSPFSIYGKQEGSYQASKDTEPYFSGNLLSNQKGEDWNQKSIKGSDESSLSCCSVSDTDLLDHGCRSNQNAADGAMDKEGPDILPVLVLKDLDHKRKKHHKADAHPDSVVHEGADVVCSLALECKSEAPDK